MWARQAVVWCFFFFLLWSGEQVSAMKGADLCRIWKHSKKGFQCPQWCAREDAKYCCHTCRLPFCCSRREAYLDSHQGHHALPKEAGATPAPPTTSLVTYTNNDSWIISLSFTVILAMITLGLLFCCCKKRYQRWRRALRMENVYRNWTATPFPPLQHQHFLFPGSSPPPYIKDPPQYSAEDPQRDIAQRPPSPAVAFHCARAEEEQEGEVALQHLLPHPDEQEGEVTLQHLLPHPDEQEGEVTLQHLLPHPDVPGPSSEAPLGRET